MTEDALLELGESMIAGVDAEARASNALLRREIHFFKKLARTARGQGMHESLSHEMARCLARIEALRGEVNRP